MRRALCCPRCMRVSAVLQAQVGVCISSAVQQRATDEGHGQLLGKLPYGWRPPADC
jgi:hypothetical protein